MVRNASSSFSLDPTAMAFRPFSAIQQLCRYGMVMKGLALVIQNDVLKTIHLFNQGDLITALETISKVVSDARKLYNCL
jgi:hypothetical protein